jgi:DNA-binding XRE family transcriptional regulator
MQQEWDALIKQYRLQFGLTQQDLGLLIGVSQKTISRWEKRENSPSIAQQRLLREMIRDPSSIGSAALSTAVRYAPVPRILCFHRNLNVQALSQPAIALRPSIANWIGLDLAPVARGILRDMIENRELQQSVLKGEVACISALTQSSLELTEHPTGSFLTTIAFLRMDGKLLCDAITVRAPETRNPEGLRAGYRVIRLDELVDS